MKKLLLALVLLWGGGAAAFWYWSDSNGRSIRFRTVGVTRGEIRSTIGATGTVEPEEVIDVGAQVAGEVKSFGTDGSKPVSWGSRVKKGSVLALLDDSLFLARVAQAEAALAKAEAEVELAEAKLKQAERDLERNRRLNHRGTGMVTHQDTDAAEAAAESARATLDVNKAGVSVAKANLEEARTNLRYSTVRSPVDGVVLDRRVNIGQTVVASLNAPSLFLIAKDLRRLEVWASVNETDIGAIHLGQEVGFTVASHRGRSFRGRVSQIRLNASMVQNVVTYTVVVSVDNADESLLPYLTARLEFEVAHRSGVLRLPKAALRWRPKPEWIAPNAPADLLRPLDERTPAAEGSWGVVWKPRGQTVWPVNVKVGLSDGAFTQVEGEGLAESTPVVVGIEREAVSTDGDASFLPHTRPVEKSPDDATASR